MFTNRFTNGILPRFVNNNPTINKLVKTPATTNMFSYQKQPMMMFNNYTNKRFMTTAQKRNMALKRVVRDAPKSTEQQQPPQPQQQYASFDPAQQSQQYYNPQQAYTPQFTAASQMHNNPGMLPPQQYYQPQQQQQMIQPYQAPAGNNQVAWWNAHQAPPAPDSWQAKNPIKSQILIMAGSLGGVILGSILINGLFI